jgi:hypothetical protein
MTVTTSSNKLAPTFWGITSDVPINTIDIRPLAVDSLLLIDNASTAMAAAAVGPDPPPGAETPETATVLMAASGLLLIGFWKRRAR